MKRKLLVAGPLLMVVALLAWMFRPKHAAGPRCKPICASNPGVRNLAFINSDVAFLLKLWGEPLPIGCKSPTRRTHRANRKKPRRKTGFLSEGSRLVRPVK